MVFDDKLKLDDKVVVELLIARGELTLPKIAKLLDVNVGSVDYHLKRLVGKGVVAKRNKRYGSTYYVSPKLVSVSKSVLWELSATLGLLLFGVFMLIAGDIWFATVCLLISSLVGAVFIMSAASRQRKEKIKAVLQSL